MVSVLPFLMVAVLIVGPTTVLAVALYWVILFSPQSCAQAQATNVALADSWNMLGTAVCVTRSGIAAGDMQVEARYTACGEAYEIVAKLQLPHRYRQTGSNAGVAVTELGSGSSAVPAGMQSCASVCTLRNHHWGMDSRKAPRS